MDGWCKVGTGFGEASEQQLTSPDVTTAVPGPGGMGTPWAWGLQQLRKPPPWSHQSHQLGRPSIFSACSFGPGYHLFSPPLPTLSLLVSPSSLPIVCPWMLVSPWSLPFSALLVSVLIRPSDSGSCCHIGLSSHLLDAFPLLLGSVLVFPSVSLLSPPVLIFSLSLSHTPSFQVIKGPALGSAAPPKAQSCPSLVTITLAGMESSSAPERPTGITWGPDGDRFLKKLTAFKGLGASGEATPTEEQRSTVLWLPNLLLGCSVPLGGIGGGAKRKGISYCV